MLVQQADNELKQLCEECLAQLEAFQRTRDAQTSTTSCEMILRRAASGDESALAVLIEIIAPLIGRNVPPDQRDDREELVQQVLIRIMGRLRRTELPFEVRSFAAFRDYLNVTLRSVIVRNSRQRYGNESSLDALQVSEGFDPSENSLSDQVENRMRLERCLTLIDNPRAQAIFRHRFLYGESLEETVQSLSAQDESLDRTTASQLLSVALRRLAKLPEVREMFESESNSE